LLTALGLIFLAAANLWACGPVFSWAYFSQESMNLAALMDPLFKFSLNAMNEFESYGVWRPVGGLIWWLKYLVAGDTFWGQHLTEYLGYSLAAFGVYLLLRQTTKSSFLAAVIAVTCWFLPARISCIAYFITGTTWMLLLGFFALYWGVKGVEERSWKTITLSCVSFASALLTREYSVIFWAVLVGYYVIVEPSSFRHRRKSVYALLLSWSVLLTWFLVMRLAVFGDRIPYPLVNSTLSPHRFLLCFSHIPPLAVKSFAGGDSLRLILSSAKTALPFGFYSLLAAIGAFLFFRRQTDAPPTEKRSFWFRLALWGGVCCLFAGLPFAYLRDIVETPSYFFITPKDGTEHHRIILVFFFSLWTLFFIARAISARVTLILGVLVTTLLFQLDASYFRFPEGSTYASWGEEGTAVPTFEKNIKDLNLPPGAKIVYWDSTVSSVPLLTHMLSLRLLRLSMPHRWRLESWGTLFQRDSAPLPCNRPVDPGVALYVWSHVSPDEPNLIRVMGYLPADDRTMTLMKFRLP